MSRSVEQRRWWRRWSDPSTCQGGGKIIGKSCLGGRTRRSLPSRNLPSITNNIT
uniref:Uncharacterized protein n=1 Tax=Rhizophora mucronata TaxID=61149 RepID=A0A2P2NEK8_RHIMU